MRELKKIRENVTDLLEHYPEARNSDTYLLILYWRLCDRLGGIGFVPWEEVDRATSFESIRRVRQKIQADGAFLPTRIEVLERRKKREEDMRQGIHDV